MPLEQWVHRRIRRNHAVVGRIAGRAGKRVVPSAGVPLPAYMAGAQAVSDIGSVGPDWVRRIAVVDRGQQASTSYRGGRRNQIGRKDRIDSVILVECCSGNAEGGT